MKLKARIRSFRKQVKAKLVPSSARLRFTKELLGDRYLIGEHTYGKPRVISWNEGTTLRVGKYCSIGSNVTIFLGSEHRTDWVSTYPFPFFWEEARGISGHPSSKGDVVIGNDVWIGDGAAVGACSLVVNSVPPYAIVAGNPARIVRYRFDEETIERLLDIQWWNWPDEKVRENVGLICSPSVREFVAKHRKL